MNKYDAIGLMSGTSLDGLDIANIKFSYDNHWKYEIVHCKTISYSEGLLKQLKNANELSSLELLKLDHLYGKWIGEQAKQFMDFHHISPDLIASHGHTIFHQPEIGLTHQIGDGNEIMNKTGVKTICDFRTLDVSLGGQGAPLVPIGDKLLFNEFDLCLNLGGFSNISFDIDNKRIAYDICPVNTVLNQLASRVHLKYDRDGAIARSGRLISELLKKLNSFEYYRQSPPKSLGIEWVQSHLLPLLDTGDIADLLNTYSHHIAYQIISSIREIRGSTSDQKLLKMLVTGGGAKNKYIMDLLESEAKGNIDIIIPDNQLIDFKEAIIFAFLGVLRNNGEINTLKSVTGAKADSSGGIIYDNLSVSAD